LIHCESEWESEIELTPVVGERKNDTIVEMSVMTSSVSFALPRLTIPSYSDNYGESEQINPSSSRSLSPIPNHIPNPNSNPNPIQPKANDQFWNIIRASKYPIFATLVVLMILTTITVVLTRKNSRDEMEASANSWGDCVLRNYNNSDNSDSWINICGAHPEVRTNIHIRLFVFALVQSPSMILFIVYIPKIIAINREIYKILLDNYSSNVRM